MASRPNDDVRARRPRARAAMWTPAIGMLIVAAWSLQVSGAVITVPADGNLQAALDRARPGDVVLLKAGATYTGNFVLPAKDGTKPILVRTSAFDRRLPLDGGRIDPAFADLLPKLKSPNNDPVLRTAPGASHWRLMLLEFVGNGSNGNMIELGDGSNAQRTGDSVPTDLVLDRLLVRGDSERGQKRGIALNSGSTTIRNSYIADIKSFGQESQAVAGWNGPGPFVIENNFLEAAGVNILIGGADPAIPDLIPTDVTIRRNHITKNPDWRSSKWTVKNLLELKTGRRVLIEGNLIEYCWTAAQPGYAVLFTVRNQDGRAPWTTIEDVSFKNNIVRHSAGGINILGTDNNEPSRIASNISIQNNLFYDINHREWSGNGAFLLIGGKAANVVVDHNTVLHTGNLVTAYGDTRGTPDPMPGFRFTNNLAQHNANGLFGNAVGVGSQAINAYFPDGVVRANVMAGGQASRYPSGNFFPSVTQFMTDFIDAAKDDFRLTPRSAYRGAGTDGADLGVNHAQLNRALGGEGQ